MSTLTRREWHIGHIILSDNLEIGKFGPRVHSSVSTSSWCENAHSRRLFIPSPRPAAHRNSMRTEYVQASPRVSRVIPEQIENKFLVGKPGAILRPVRSPEMSDRAYTVVYAVIWTVIAVAIGCMAYAWFLW